MIKIAVIGLKNDVKFKTEQHFKRLNIQVRLYNSTEIKKIKNLNGSNISLAYLNSKFTSHSTGAVLKKCKLEVILFEGSSLNKSLTFIESHLRTLNLIG